MSTLLSDEDALHIAAKEWLGYAPSPPFDAADPANDKLLRMARAVAAAQERATLGRAAQHLEREAEYRHGSDAVVLRSAAVWLRALTTEERSDGE